MIQYLNYVGQYLYNRFRNPTFLTFTLLFATFIYINFPFRINLPKPITSVTSAHKNFRLKTIIPKVIHQMWKSKDFLMPDDLTRWRDGCELVNPDYEFKFYYDADLRDFVEREYVSYLPLFNSLTGVYMADMARVLLSYHYGGIYMDLDFYCHRPFSCLETQVSKLPYPLRF